MEMITLRARASSTVHAIKFYPNENKYIIVEGTDINREAVILIRDFDEDPYTVGLSRTSIGADEIAVISVYGDISPGFTVGFTDGEVEVPVIIDGVADFGVVITGTITIDEAKALGAGAAKAEK